MIKVVTNKKELNLFIYYISSLYKDDPYYVFPVFSSLKKELNREVLEEKKYTALLCYKNNLLQGRILYTIDDNKQLHEKVCFFSFFDCVNDILVCKELFNYIENDMKEKNIKYIEGTYSPYDPDTRRGVLATCFNERPMLFTSYNYAYYNDLLLQTGYVKAYDTVSVKVDLSTLDYKKLSKYHDYVLAKNNIIIESLSWRHINRDLNDVKKIFDLATTEINYQLPPSIKVIRGFLMSFGFFINKDLIKIARHAKTKEPLGFCLVLPDYNQIFQKTKGRVLPLTLLRNKKKITAARGMLQYVIPKYQTSGLIGCMFCDIYETFKRYGITSFEGGTIMEDNLSSIKVLEHFNGYINKIYRIYRKDL